MRDSRLFDDYASLIFKYCDEHSDLIIKQLAKLVKNRNLELFSTKKNIRTHQKTEVKRVQNIQNLETNRKKERKLP